VAQGDLEAMGLATVEPALARMQAMEL